MLAYMSVRCCFKSLVLGGVSSKCVLTLIPKLGSQQGVGIISFQFVQTFDQNLSLLNTIIYKHLSDVSIASYSSLPFKSKESKQK